MWRQRIMYVRAKLWLSGSFKNSKAVLDVEDKGAGILAGRGSVRYEPVVFFGSTILRGFIEFKITIMLKMVVINIHLPISPTTALPDGSPAAEFGILTTASEPAKSVKWAD